MQHLSNLKLTLYSHISFSYYLRINFIIYYFYTLEKFVIVLSQELVRFCACYRIKPHNPPLVQTPAISFKFQSCDCNPQAECLLGYLYT